MQRQYEQCLLVQVLNIPGMALGLDERQWDLLVRQARTGNLLAYLARMMQDNGILQFVPEGPQSHLVSALKITSRHSMAVKWELGQIAEALYSLSVPVVVLKGAAYVLADLPIGQSRLFHDIDIMVPKSALSDVEQKLLAWGWRSTHHNQYDQHYYRTWMHEIPPLKHVKRGTVLDVHHTILPLTAKLKPNSEELIQRSVSSEISDMYYLQPVDMVLHSATHLFHDGELENGLRDLVDLKGLIELFSDSTRFWEDLVDRARQLDLLPPLRYAIRYLAQLLSIEFPGALMHELGLLENRAKDRMMNWMFERALMPNHSTCDRFDTGLCRWLLYVRSHHLRMPMHLLIPHLLRKALTNENAELPKEVRRFVEMNK